MIHLSMFSLLVPYLHLIILRSGKSIMIHWTLMLVSCLQLSTICIGSSRIKCTSVSYKTYRNIITLCILLFVLYFNYNNLSIKLYYRELQCEEWQRELFLV